MLKGSSSNFSLKYPDKQKGLLEVVPKDSVPTEYINQYSIEYEVSCALCDKHTPHKNGFTASFPGKGIALIGKDCGRKHFGTHDAIRFETDLKFKRENAAKCARLLKLSNNLTDALLIFPKLVELEYSLLKLIGELHRLFIDENLKKMISVTGRLEFGGPDYDNIKPITIRGAKCLLSGPRTFSYFNKSFKIGSNLSSLNEDKVLADLENNLDQENEFIWAVSAGVRFIRDCKIFLEDSNLKELNYLAQEYEVGFTGIEKKHPKGNAPVFVVECTEQQEEFVIAGLPNFDFFEDWVKNSELHLKTE